MEKSRYTRGLERLAEVDGAAGKNVVDSLKDIAPGLADYLIEFAFGDIYCRPGLSLQEREIVSLTTLLTQGGLRTAACRPRERRAQRRYPTRKSGGSHHPLPGLHRVPAGAKRRYCRQKGVRRARGSGQ